MKYVAALVVISLFMGLGYAMLEELIPTGPGKNEYTQKAVAVYDFTIGLFGLALLSYATMFMGYIFGIMILFQKDID